MTPSNVMTLKGSSRMRGAHSGSKQAAAAWSAECFQSVSLNFKSMVFDLLKFHIVDG